MLGLSRLWDWRERRVMRWTLTFWVLLFLPAFVDSQTWVWTAETVDTVGVGMSLAIDNDGNVHMSYSSGALKYAFRPADQSRWYTMPLSYGAEFSKIYVDIRGNPHICAVYPFRDLRYAHFDGKKWAVDEIIPNAPGVQASCALAIGPDGTPHVAWYRVTEDYKHIRYAVLKDGVWTTRTLDWDEQTGKWNSIVLDSHGHPYISYDAFIKGLLKCAHWDGKNWKVQVVDSRGSQYNVGMGNSIALDAHGDVHISYYTENTLRYARQQNGTWKIDIVDTVSPIRSAKEHRSSLVFDNEGFPHISYEDLAAVKHAYWDGERWRIQVISPSAPLMRYSAMAIDEKRNILYICYADADQSLQVAIGRMTEVSQSQPATHTKKEER